MVSNISKKVIIPTITLITLLSIGFLGTSVINANDNTDTYTPVVQRLAETFGLEENDVQAVFDAVRDERHDQMKTRLEDRLNQLVSENTISEDQKNALLQKRQEMEESRNQMRTFFEENNLDPNQLMLGFEQDAQKGFKSGHRMGMNQ